MYSLTISGRSKGRDGGLIPTPLIFATKQRAMAQSWGSNNFVLTGQRVSPLPLNGTEIKVWISH